MFNRDFTQNQYQRQRHIFDLFSNQVLLVIAVSALPTVVLLIISYFQSLSFAKANLEGIIKIATAETNRLLDDANTILRRNATDLQNADEQTAVKILRRQIYNDFRFREAGIINADGFLTLSNLEIIDPPIPKLLDRSGFDPTDPNLQLLGPGRTQLMQEQSILLILRGSGQIGAVYLVVDPIVLTYFLEVVPTLDLGTSGFIAFMSKDERLLSSVGALPQDIFYSLKKTSFDTLQVRQTTDDGTITIVGTLSRRWVLRHWLQELTVSVPLTLLISGVLSYLFIRRLQQVHTLDYELKQGLAQDEFEIHYQPIVDLETRQCIGSEALLRWRHPQRGLIYPSLFIPIAEQTGFIIPLTEWLIEKVIQDQAILRTRFQNLYFSMNLSPSQLNTGDVDRLIQTLKKANNHSNITITFEITENKLIEEQGQVVQDAIARLRLWGVQFAIDDFGTGYSNLGYLQRLDVDQLKLDQLFIKGLEHNTNMAQIVDGLIDLGGRIGLTIVAEGIENEVQYQYLKDRGIRYGQGWLFSRPLPFADFERFLQTQES